MLLSIWYGEKNKEDYGQTLASHGVGPGCYIVLPVRPSTARDTVATWQTFRRSPV